MRQRERTAAQEENYHVEALQQMEEAALKVYKEKDVKVSRDFTAKLYNNEPGLPGLEGVEYKAKEKPGPSQSSLKPTAEADKVLGPVLAGVSQEMQEKGRLLGSGKAGPWNPLKTKTLKTVSTLKGGTKWHKPAPPSLWHEAKDEKTGTSYYFHSVTQNTRWEVPEQGFVSLAKQAGREDEEESSGDSDEEPEPKRRKQLALGPKAFFSRPT
jgi:hypothetical protein